MSQPIFDQFEDAPDAFLDGEYETQREFDGEDE